MVPNLQLSIVAKTAVIANVFLDLSRCFRIRDFKTGLSAQFGMSFCRKGESAEKFLATGGGAVYGRGLLTRMGKQREKIMGERFAHLWLAPGLSART
jgi:hypothetical protein